MYHKNNKFQDKRVRSGFIRIINADFHKISPHKIVISHDHEPKNKTDNSAIISKKTPTLQIPHVERVEFANKFRVIEEKNSDIKFFKKSDVFEEKEEKIEVKQTDKKPQKKDVEYKYNQQIKVADKLEEINRDLKNEAHKITDKIEADKKKEDVKFYSQRKNLEQSKTEKTYKKANKKNYKSKKRNSLGKFIKEFSITSIIAVVTIFVLSLAFYPGVYKQYAGKYLNPEKMQETQIALEKSVNNKKAQKKIVRPKLLPVAGITRENVKKFPSLELAVAPLENRIIIPKIGKNIPIVDVPKESLLQENWNKLEKDIQKGLEKGVVHYPGTATPGQNGNFFVTGHSSYYPWADGNYKDVFAMLHDLEVGDEFFIYWNQKKYHYKIFERKVVKPSNTDVLDQPADQSISTLMTCTPMGTAINRLILVAKEI